MNCIVKESRRIKIIWFGKKIKNDRAKIVQITASHLGFLECPAILNHIELRNERKSYSLSHASLMPLTELKKENYDNLFKLCKGKTVDWPFKGISSLGAVKHLFSNQGLYPINLKQEAADCLKFTSISLLELIVPTHKFFVCVYFTL